MHHILNYLTAAAACTLLAAMSFAQSTKNIRGSSLHPTGSKEAPARAIPPLPALPTLGRGVFIRPLADISFLGKGDFEVLPRISHINITVDGTMRHEMVFLFNLEPGPHKVLIELADHTQKVISSETVEFMLPDPLTAGSRVESLGQTQEPKDAK